MNAPKFVRATLTALTFAYAAPVAAAPAASCEKVWMQSDQRATFAHGRDSSSAPRDIAYTKFMDIFWRSMDRQPAAKTVGDVLDHIQTSFLDASRKQGKKVRSYGITPQLVVDDLTCGAGGNCEGRIFLESQLRGSTSLSTASTVQKLLAGSARLKLAEIYVGFSRDERPGVEFEVLEGIEANLSMGSAVSAMRPATISTDDAKNLDGVLACLKRN